MRKPKKWDALTKDEQEARLEKERTRCRLKSAKYRQDHPEKVKASYTKWVSANPEKRRSLNARWRENNPEAKARHDKVYAKKHPEKIRCKANSWVSKNRTRVRAHKKRSREKHLETGRRASKAARERLSDAYLAGCLKIPADLARFADGLLESKREHLKILRELKQQYASESK